MFCAGARYGFIEKVKGGKVNNRKVKGKWGLRSIGKSCGVGVITQYLWGVDMSFCVG